MSAPAGVEAAPDPDASALSDGDRQWSHGELSRVADRLAGRLRAAGVRRGDRVALLVPQGAAGVLALHAVWRIGAIVAPLNPKWSRSQLARPLEAIAPSVVVVTGETADLAAAAAAAPGAAPRLLPLSRADLDAGSGARDALSGPDLGADPSLSIAPSPLAAPSPSDVLAVLWTSGTGGRPRGVELTRGNLEASAEAAREHLELSPSDSWYAALSPAHVGGLALLHRAAVLGCRVEVRSGFDPSELSALIDAGRVSHASLVPVMLAGLLEARGERPAPDSLRCILLGGAAAPLTLVERAVGLGFPIALTYGLTEASSQVATAPPRAVREAIAAGVALPAAPPIPGVELRIGDEGEIQVRGATVARGYHGSDAAAFPRDAEGWFRTGDAGTLDALGNLRVTGRLSERIVSGGVNVDPVEVEEVVRSHPAVSDAAALALPDPRWGERVGVATVLLPGGSLDLEELLDFTRPRLASAARPRVLLVLESLPRNANGKVDRAQLRRLDWLPPDT